MQYILVSRRNQGPVADYLVYVIAIGLLAFEYICLQYLCLGTKELVRSIISKSKIVRPLEPFSLLQIPNFQ